MATELEFKVGDTVRLTGYRWNDDLYPKGSVVTITGVDYGEVAHFNEDNGVKIFIIPGHGYDAELVTEYTKPQFKVGDRVRLTGKAWNDGYEPSKGEIVTIEGVDRDGDAYFRNNSGHRLFILNAGYEAELVTEDAEPQFKVGDKVRLTGHLWDTSNVSDDLGGVGSIVVVESVVKGLALSGDWMLSGVLRGWETELVTEEPKYDLETLIQDIGLTNQANGFNRTTEEARDPDYLSSKLLLIVSEIIEAQDEIRNGHEVDFTYYTKDGKPEGFVSEIADVFIRVLGTVHELGITEQFLKMVPEKLEYNKGRGFRHGKKF